VMLLMKLTKTAGREGARGGGGVADEESFLWGAGIQKEKEGRSQPYSGKKTGSRGVKKKNAATKTLTEKKKNTKNKTSESATGQKAPEKNMPVCWGERGKGNYRGDPSDI